MKKTPLLAAALTLSITANAAVLPKVNKNESPAVAKATKNEVKDCSSESQTVIVADILANRDTKDSPDSCAVQLDTILEKIVPTSVAAPKVTVKAFERDSLFSTITFKSASSRIVELHRLRVFKKDGTQAEFKYGSKQAADKAWSEWKTQYVTATDCEADADKVVNDTKLLTPGFGRLECAGAYARGASRYNPEVVVKRNHIVDWNGLILNTAHVASLSIVTNTWVVFDGPKQAYQATIRRLRASSSADGAKPTWEVAYGRKTAADNALASIVRAMEQADVSPNLITANKSITR